ncbi:hypothetical protein LZ30DRAFT_800554 [Colletotrichum cereale]|nr:hypothetical protein LZ30DRAFT_800554 [Colletotrichum cereale]
MAASQLNGMLKRDGGFLMEMWTWFAIGAFVILLRFVVRLSMSGIRGLKGDDYKMLATSVLYTVCFIMVDLVYTYGSNVDLTPAQISVLSDEEVARVVKGSEFQQIACCSYTVYLWYLKALTAFFLRLTFDLWQHARFLKYLTWFTTLSYLAVVGTITFSCLPFSENWGCVFRAQSLLVTTLFILKEIRVPLYKRIFIAMLTRSGLFVIASAIMRVAVTLGSEPSTITVNRWGQWHYRPPARTLNPKETAKRSRTAVGRQRRGSLLGWMNPTTSRLGTIARTRGRGSPIDVELGDTANNKEMEPLGEEGSKSPGNNNKARTD